MKSNSIPKSAQQNSNLSVEPESASMASSSFSPPPFQLQASSLADFVSPVQALAQGAPLQMVKLDSFNDKDPKHDPSHLTDAQIKGTDEYIKLEQTHHLVPTTDPSVLYSPAEILLACRLMVRSMREGVKVDPFAQSKTYLDQARAQIGSAAMAVSMEDDLSWTSTFPGSNNSEFGDWLLAGGKEPAPSSGVMNCWELVMFSAYKAGFAQKGSMSIIYKQFAKDLAAGDIPKAVTTFENALKKGQEQVYNPNDKTSPKPLTGDIVIFNTLAAHVAVATGNTTAKGEVEIVSLWTQNSKKTYKTSVEELLKATSGPVRFYSPNW